MTENQIDYLRKCVAVPSLTCWYRDGERLRKIESFGTYPDEPSPVVYIGNGQYAALWNCETTDFMVTTNDLAVWPKD